MTLPLEKRHALIVGGSGEMGFQAARALVAAGARVTLLARGSEGLTTAATRLINEIDGDVLTVTADLAQPQTIARAMAHATEAFGDVDILVLALRDEVEGGYDRVAPPRFLLAMENVLAGSANILAATVPSMQARAGGRVIFLLGRDALHGRPQAFAGCAIQHALVGMMRSLARDVADRGVSVNAIAAGAVETDRLAVAIDEVVARTRRDRAAVRMEMAATNPQQRLIQPEEIGQTVLWLALPASRGLTGQVIAVDGGESG